MMANLKTLRLLALIVGVCLLIAAPPASAQTQHDPIAKEGLLKALSKKILSSKELVGQVEQRKVSFQLTPADEQEIRSAGKYLGRNGLDNLVAAIRSNYRVKEGVSSGKTIILLADFRGINGENIGLTNILKSRLDRDTAEFPEIEVVSLREPITSDDGRKKALEKGREYNASIVLWGWFTRSEEQILVNVNFEMMRSPHYMPISSLKGDYKAPLSTLKEFTLQEYLSDELTTIILAATALARMDVGDYWGAANRLNEALSKNVSPQIVLGYEDIFFFSTLAYIIATSHDGPESVKKYMPQVINNLEQFIKNHKDDIAAFQLLGLAHILVGEADKALSDGRKMLELGSDPLIQMAAYQILLLSAMLKDDNTLVNEYAKNMVETAKGLELPAALEEIRGLAYFSLGDEKNALESYDRALKLDANEEMQIRIRYNKANIYYEKNETWDQALEELRQIIQQTPKDADAYSFMGDIFYGRKEYTLAINYYQTAIRLNPKNAQFYTNLGTAYNLLSYEMEALNNYNRALEIDPNNAQAYYWRGSLLDKFGKYKDALIDIDKSLKLDPKFVDALYRRVFINAKSNNFEDALSDYKKIVEIDSENPNATNLLGYISYTKGEYQAAINYFNIAIGLAPKIVGYYTNRGNAKRDAGKIQEALNDYRLALELDSKDTRTLADRGYLYMEAGQFNKALLDLNKCLQLDPRYVDALYSRAFIYSKSGNPSAALADYKKITEIRPYQAKAFFYHGEILYQKGLIDKALEDFDQAINLSPDYAEAYLQRGFLFLAIGDRRKARADFLKIKELTKDPQMLQQADEQLKQLSVK
jgi:tetratricopeptide (TPR) repeat protein